MIFIPVHDLSNATRIKASSAPAVNVFSFPVEFSLTELSIKKYN